MLRQKHRACASTTISVLQISSQMHHPKKGMSLALREAAARCATRGIYCFYMAHVRRNSLSAFQDAEAEALCLRQDLGLELPAISAADASMRYSRRTRGIRPEDELHEEDEVDMAEARAQQQRQAQSIEPVRFAQRA